MVSCLICVGFVLCLIFVVCGCMLFVRRSPLLFVALLFDVRRRPLFAIWW